MAELSHWIGGCSRLATLEDLVVGQNLAEIGDQQSQRCLLHREDAIGLDADEIFVVSAIDVLVMWILPVSVLIKGTSFDFID